MLPNEKAHEPVEDAHEPNAQGEREEDDGKSSISTPVKKRKKLGITFAEATTSEPASQSSSAYKEVLSQPPSSLTHRQRLQWLQRRRTAGLWAQCDDCDHWRYLPGVLDAHELPPQWRCSMNPDKSFASCSVPEAPLRVREEEDLIHGEYAAGSVVWARLAGWPWWPAMVDDEPDTEQYYWLDGFSDIPTHYNVTFLDEAEVTRAWIAPDQLKPYVPNRGMVKQLSKDKRYKKRLGAAITQAEDASRLSLTSRLAKYSFTARFAGAINKPRKVAKAELKRFKDRLKRKYNVDFDDESSSESDERSLEVVRKNKSVVKTAKGKKTVLSPPKISKAAKKVEVPVQANDDSEKMGVEVNAKAVDPEVQYINTVSSTIPEGSFDNDTSDTYAPPIEKSETQSTAPGDTDRTFVDTPTTRKAKDSFVSGRKLQNSMECGGSTNQEQGGQVNVDSGAYFKQPSSMIVQIGSNATKDASVSEGFFDSDTSKTYIPESESESETIETSVVRKIQTRSASGDSNDFEF